MTDTLTAALRWHAIGASVVRVSADGAKRPLGGWKQYQTTRADAATLQEWFRHGYPGVGIICGAVSNGIEMLEFEGRAVAEGLVEQFAEIARYSDLDEIWKRMWGYAEKTPSGGYHLVYKVTGGPVLSNTKLARRPATEHELAASPAEKFKVLIETRGEGGFVVVAPSHGPVHPSGRPWFVCDGDIGTLPVLTAEERDAMFSVARCLDQMPQLEPTPEPAPAWFPGEGLTPGDDFEARTAWKDILVGWKELYTASDGTTYWRRPGKKLGTSATTGHTKDRDRLYVFSTSTEFQAETPYTKFGAYTLLHHSGDYKAAARELRRRGYGDPGEQFDAVPHQRGTGEDEGAGPQSGLVAGLNLPEEFWVRAELRLIRQAAHSRMCSPDAVFAAVLARLSGMLDPSVRADSGRGLASLNTFSILAGPSSAGKSTAHRCAQDLLPPPVHLPLDWPDGVPLGSGEGLAELYMGIQQVPTGETTRDGKPKMKSERAQVRHCATVYADEGEAMAKMAERSGATVGETIRRAWSGETIGQANGNKDTTRIIARGSYSLGMVIGFQPETARPLLGDAAAGTPQRFLWLWALDPNIPDEPVEWPQDARFAELPAKGTTMAFPTSVKAELRAHQLAVGRGETRPAPLDGHWPLMRVKIAALLAILGGRTRVSDGDWELSQMVWTTSCAVRDRLIALAQQEREKEHQERDRRAGDRAVHIKGREHGADVGRAARTLYKAVYRAEGKQLSKSAARRALASKDRRHLWDEALEYALGQGWLLELDEAHVGLGRAVP